MAALNPSVSRFIARTRTKVQENTAARKRTPFSKNPFKEHQVEQVSDLESNRYYEAMDVMEIEEEVVSIQVDSPSDELTWPQIAMVGNQLRLTEEERNGLPREASLRHLEEYLQQFKPHIRLELDVQGEPNGSRPVSDAAPNFAVRVKRQKTIVQNHQHPKRKKEAFKKQTGDLTQFAIEPPEEEKSASWMELFYDLFFVANLSIFTHAHQILDMNGMLIYIGWFAVLWWSWCSQTMYGVRFDSDDLLHRFWKFLELCALALFAGNSGAYTQNSFNGFVVSYIILKMVLVFEYAIVYGYATPKARKPLRAYVLVNIFSAVVWTCTLSAIMPYGKGTLTGSHKPRYAAWYASMIIEIIVNIVFSTSTTVTFAGTHIAERMGLFTIIILGEGIIGFLTLVNQTVALSGVTQIGFDVGILLILVIIIIYCQWWIYFDDFTKEVDGSRAVHRQFWIYLHFILHTCLVLLGVGSTDLVRLYKATHLHTTDPGAGSVITNSTLFSGNESDSHNFARSVFLRSLAPHSAHNEVPSANSTAPAHDSSMAAEEEAVSQFVTQYFLVIAALIFIINGALKFIYSKPRDKFDRMAYCSRFILGIVLVFLLLVKHDNFSAFSLLGIEATFCVLQLSIDCALLYFAANKHQKEIEEKDASLSEKELLN